MEMKQIGVIRTPFQSREGMPIQAARSDVAGEVEVFPDYAGGLAGLEEFSHIFLFYVLHRSPLNGSLLVKPFLDDQEHGVFATRWPVRPNPLGFSVVRLEAREGNILRVCGVDMLDGTPLLDIKPYVPEFDIFQPERIGWYQARKYE